MLARRAVAPEQRRVHVLAPLGLVGSAWTRSLGILGSPKHNSGLSRTRSAHWQVKPLASATRPGKQARTRRRRWSSVIVRAAAHVVFGQSRNAVRLYRNTQSWPAAP